MNLMKLVLVAAVCVFCFGGCATRGTPQVRMSADVSAFVSAIDRQAAALRPPDAELPVTHAFFRWAACEDPWLIRTRYISGGMLYCIETPVLPRGSSDGDSPWTRTVYSTDHPKLILAYTELLTSAEALVAAELALDRLPDESASLGTVLLLGRHAFPTRQSTPHTYLVLFTHPLKTPAELIREEMFDMYPFRILAECLDDEWPLAYANQLAEGVEFRSSESLSRTLTVGPGPLAASLVMSFDHMVESYIRLEVSYPVP